MCVCIYIYLFIYLCTAQALKFTLGQGYEMKLIFGCTSTDCLMDQCHLGHFSFQNIKNHMNACVNVCCVGFKRRLAGDMSYENVCCVSFKPILKDHLCCAGFRPEVL